MATEICITIEDDGTFSVDQEEASQEASENESSENEQKFKTKAEALAAAGKMIDAAAIQPTENESTENPADDTASAESAEDTAMQQAYRPGTTGR